MISVHEVRNLPNSWVVIESTAVLEAVRAAAIIALRQASLVSQGDSSDHSHHRKHIGPYFYPSPFFLELRLRGSWNCMQCVSMNLRQSYSIFSLVIFSKIQFHSYPILLSSYLLFHFFSSAIFDPDIRPRKSTAKFDRESRPRKSTAEIECNGIF